MLASRILCAFPAAVLFVCALLAPVISQRAASNAFLRRQPSVELQVATTSITIPCPPGAQSRSRSCPSSADVQLPLLAMASGFTKDATYSYSVGGGKIVGQGSKVFWDLTGVWPGQYVVKVDVLDSRKHHASSSVTVTIAPCQDCTIIEPCMFTLVVTCYDRVQAGTPITCKLASTLGEADPITHRPFTYKWSARDSDDHDLTATITKEREYISIPTKGLGGKHVTTTVEVKEVDPSCNNRASGVTFVEP